MAQAKRVSKKKSIPRRTAKKKQGGLPGWAWMFIGLLVGAVITLIIFLTKTDEKLVTESVAKKTDIKIEKAKVKKSVEPEKEESLLNFDFYKILPDMEVLIPESELEYESVQKKVIYFLQAGSFKKIEDAESRSTELILMNFEPTVQTVTVDGDKTWHRVRIGPFKNRLALDKARRLLQDNNIQHIVFREREKKE